MTIDAALVVVDSSVAYKWFGREDEASLAEADELMQGHIAGRHVLCAPAHLPAEVLNGLRYAGLGLARLKEAAEALEGVELALFPLDAELLAASAEIALDHDLTVHDALFCALAQALDCELVTADRKQASATCCKLRLLT